VPPGTRCSARRDRSASPAGGAGPIIGRRARRREGIDIATWIEAARDWSARIIDPALSALLVVLAGLIFVAEPLAAEGIDTPLVVLGLAATLLILIVVLGSHQHAALFIVVTAGALHLASVLVAFARDSVDTRAGSALGAVLGLVAVSGAISGVVFGPGRVTAHRVRGAIVLYLAVALIYAWVYRLIALLAAPAFTGMSPAHMLHLAPFVYYSLTTLTTLGFGDITPVDPIARAVTTSEALIGQLYPALILGRMLMLYADTGKDDRGR
jgi:hypothetical protein